MRRPPESKTADIPQEFFEKFASMLQKMGITDKEEIHRLKIRLCKEYHLPRIPGNPEILANIPKEVNSRLKSALQLKPMRTASGVTPVAVMTSPAPCPHGKCIYCPGGVENGSPQSYTGQEPAALRAESNGFDPYLQTRNRIEQYAEMGHPTDKIDLIIMGGTFTARPLFYQDYFIKGCLDALNGRISPDLKTAQKWNEAAPHRVIGMTIETRPDWCLTPQISQIMRLGGTRVELGVQTTFDSVLEMVKRGHTTREIRLSTRLVKDAGLKLVYHMMPGLPGSDIKMDLHSFREIFENPDYRPDMLKIYPTLVVKGTELYEMWKRGEYSPLTTEEAVNLIAELKKFLPRYVRIQRIQRDIPARLIEAGVKKSNLRQLVKEALANEGRRCHCIRCREVGHTERKAKELELMEMEYAASGGKELFLSFEDPENDVLVGYLRLRFPGENSENGEMGRAIVRELRVLGSEVPIGERKMDRFQHQGYGRALLQRAEELAVENGWEKLIITSGIGVRSYYINLGYVRALPYMEKSLSVSS